jgi:hypothetical protein
MTSAYCNYRLASEGEMTGNSGTQAAMGVNRTGKMTVKNLENMETIYSNNLAKFLQW